MTVSIPTKISLVAAAIVFAQPAAAQFDVTSVGNWQLNTNTTHVQGLILQNQTFGNARRQPLPTPPPRLVRPGARPDGSPSTVSAATVLPKLAFRPSPAVRQQTVSDVLKRFTITDPAQRAQMYATFGKPAFFASFDAALRPYGLSTSNLADMQATWMLEGWMAVNGFVGEPTVKQAQAVRNQVASAFGATPAVMAMTAAQRQSMADELAIYGSVYASGRALYQNNPGERTQFQNTLRRTLARSGFDPLAFRLTDQGFVQK